MAQVQSLTESSFDTSELPAADGTVAVVPAAP